LSPSVVDELYFSDKTVVIIDVLRATSTIIAAMENGAKEIVPVNSIEFATKASSSMFGGQTLLGGERNTKKIDGFNLGNSPLEYTRESIAGKSIIFYTTNGTKAIVKSKYSKITLICSFLNVKSVAEYIVKQNLPSVEIVCSGRNNLFCIEDTVCAGLIVQEIQKHLENVILSDGSAAALSLAKSHEGNLSKMIFESEHGKTLVENGFEEDVVYCSRLNSSTYIPVYFSNIIKSLSASTEE
jgi:2-phosphosulfolactate phosphatase